MTKTDAVCPNCETELQAKTGPCGVCGFRFGPLPSFQSNTDTPPAESGEPQSRRKKTTDRLDRLDPRR